MHAFYRDYFWKKGIPQGISKVASPLNEPNVYKIVMDPYMRWISIEKWGLGAFIEMIYDSKLLDFRKLKPQEQLAWRKERVTESQLQVTSLLYNEDDRLVFKEVAFFEGTKVRRCHFLTLFNILVARHELFYKELSDECDGVILYDRNNHPVMKRLYTDWETLSISEESWIPNEDSFSRK